MTSTDETASALIERDAPSSVSPYVVQHSPESAIAWSGRERLVRGLREAVVMDRRRGPSLPGILTLVVQDFVKKTGNKRFRRLLKKGVGNASFDNAVSAWVTEMPATHRADWLLERLSEAAGIRWEARPSPIEGPILLPVAERDRIRRRFERVWRRSIDQSDGEPDPTEYADALDAEIDRLGRTHESLAVRVLTERFPDAWGDPTLTFRTLLDRKRLARAEDVLRFFERRLTIKWSDPSGERGR